MFSKDRILLFRTDRLQSLDRAEQDHPSKDLKNYTILDWLSGGVSQKTDSSEYMNLRVKFTQGGVRAYERSNGRDEHVTIHADGSGELVTEMHRSNLRYFSQFFLGMGADAVVEEPSEMVEWIRDQLQGMLRAYGSLDEDSQV